MTGTLIPGTLTTGPLATLGTPAFDRIGAVEPGVRAVAYLNVTATMPYFATHFPRYPVLPGVLLVESAVALARLAAGSDTARLRRAQRLRFRRFVVPGDQVELTVSARGNEPELPEDTQWEMRARVDGEIVASIGVLVLASRLVRTPAP